MRLSGWNRLGGTPKVGTTEGCLGGLNRDDFGGRLGRQLELELVEQKLEFVLGLGVAGELDLAAVRGGNVDVDHLHGGELLEHAARRQPGSEPSTVGRA